MRRTEGLSSGQSLGGGSTGDHGVVAEVTRASTAVITDPIDPLVWKEVGRRVQGMLRRRGATTWVAEDLAQEVLTRAVANQVSFSDADDLMRWCVPVARNLHIDHARHGRWTDETASIPEARDALDVERLVLARLELHGVLGHLASLTDNDRQAIVDSINGVTRASDRKSSVSEAVRRHRARQRLARLVTGAAAVWGWLLHPRLRLSRPALAAALPVALLSGLVAAPLLTAPADDPARPAVVSVPVNALVPEAQHLSRTAGTGVAPALRPADARAVQAATTSAGATRRPVVRTTAPTGNVLDIGTTESPGEGVVVCVEDFPVVADRCVASPVAPEGASARVVISNERTG